MNRYFTLSIVLGLTLFALGKSSYFVQFKMPLLMTSVTFAFGLFSTTRSQSILSFLGLVLAYFVGSFMIVHANYGSIYGMSAGFQLKESIKILLLENNEYMLWIVGFPAGFYLRPFVEQMVYQKPKKRKSSKKMQNFGELETRPVFLALRDQPSEICTSPSIHLN